MKKCTLLLICIMIQQHLISQIPSYTVDTNFTALVFEGGQSELQFADINQDGNPDLLTVGDHGSPYINTNQHGISVYFGNGTTSGWTLSQNGDFGYGGIAVGDVNNDGFMDVGYGIHHNYSLTDFGDQLIEVALGDGTGLNWIPCDDSLGTAGETYGMFGTDFGDVDNDGLLDILSGSFGCCAGTHVYLNRGNGVWHHSFGYVNGNTEHYVQFGDLNHDGNLDFVCCHQYGAAYFGDGTGNFLVQPVGLPYLGTLGYYDISLDDIDNDGDDDFGFIHNNSVPYVYKWNSITNRWDSSSTGLSSSGPTASAMKLADLNGDGYSDAVVAVTGSIEIYLGNGGSLWNHVLSIPIPNMTFCQDIAIADIDHNGFPEIAFLSEYNNGLFSTINKLKILVNTYVPNKPEINQTFPSGNECLPASAVRNITWTSGVPAGNSSSVNIAFSSTGPAGPWITVAAAAPDNGNYQWTVPLGITSYQCHIRLILTDSTAQLTDTAFNSNPFQVGVCDPVLSIHAVRPDAEYVVYPNPFKDALTINTGIPLSRIEIFNPLGCLTYSEKADAPAKTSYTIHPDLEMQGIYFIKLLSVNGSVKTIKLIHQ
ncbi:MAG: T9SS type A sorting domain-containing protein [Bacteroidia bacterium]|nr:T9SS type A sorting domain-containing protein [Bacteroidia bacterium]